MKTYPKVQVSLDEHGLIGTGPGGLPGSSYYGSAMRCLRLFAAKHRLNIGGGSISRGKGSAVHLGVAHALATQAGCSVMPWAEAMDTVMRLGVFDVPPNTFPGLKRAVEGALPVLDDLEPIYIEASLPIELGTLDCPGHQDHGEPVIYGPKNDLWARHGRKVIWVDHKTTSTPITGPVQRIYTLHIQPLMAHHIGHNYFGRDFGGAYFHYISVVPPYRSVLVPSDPAPAAVRDIPQQLFEVAHRIAEFDLATERGDLRYEEWPATYHELGCYHRYGPCDAWDLCRWGSVTPRRFLNTPDFDFTK